MHEYMTNVERGSFSSIFFFRAGPRAIYIHWPGPGEGGKETALYLTFRSMRGNGGSSKGWGKTLTQKGLAGHLTRFQEEKYGDS